MLREHLQFMALFDSFPQGKQIGNENKDLLFGRKKGG